MRSQIAESSHPDYHKDRKHGYDFVDAGIPSVGQQV